nr:glycosyltransferase family 2 protein [Paenibacillus sp. GSMTC-2017]
MIVRNEDGFIKECLEHVHSVVDEIIIVDTGSTDDTIKICESYGAIVLRYEWNEDFAAARNYGLQHATGDWILWLDADEILAESSRGLIRDVLGWNDKDMGVIGLINYFGDYPVSVDRAYHVQQHRLFRNHIGFKFQGRIHERLNVKELNIKENRIHYLATNLHHYGYLDPVRTQKNKSERNLTMLLQELDKEDTNPWVHYHIASEYNQMSEYQKAYDSVNKSILAFIKSNQLPPSLIYRLKYETMLSYGTYEGIWPGIDKAILLYADYVDLHFIKGVVLWLKKRYVLARETFEHCLELGDKMTRHLTLYGLGTFQAHYYIGRCFEQERHLESAIEAYKRSIETCPTYEPAKEALKKLKVEIAEHAEEMKNQNHSSINISLCMIVRDEEAHLKQCLESVIDIIDELIIVDTGSMDRTKEIAESFGAIIYDMEWINDFSVARNFAFSKATKDFILWLDADDIVTSEAQERLLSLKGRLTAEVDCVSMLYHQLFDANERLTSTLRCNRLVRSRSHFQWQGALNDYLSVNGTTLQSDIAIIHKRGLRSTERNLCIYKSRLEAELSLSPYETLGYANELFNYELYDKAIVYYTKYLNEQPKSVREHVTACCKLSECAGKLQQHDLRIQALFRTFEFGFPPAEVCYKIGEWHSDRNSDSTAIEWYKQAIESPEDDYDKLPPNKDYKTWLPLLKLCQSYNRLGQYKIAYDYNESALHYYPDHPELLANRVYFMKQHNIYSFGGTN